MPPLDPSVPPTHPPNLAPPLEFFTRVLAWNSYFNISSPISIIFSIWGGVLGSHPSYCWEPGFLLVGHKSHELLNLVLRPCMRLDGIRTMIVGVLVWTNPLLVWTTLIAPFWCNPKCPPSGEIVGRNRRRDPSVFRVSKSNRFPCLSLINSRYFSFYIFL